MLMLIGCSSLTLDKINNPAKRASKKELIKYEQKGVIYKEDAIYSFEQRIGTRNKILDSLNYRQCDTLIIIDRISSNYSGPFEESFFLCGLEFKWIEQPQYFNPNSPIKIISKNINDLNKYKRTDILTIYADIKKSHSEIEDSTKFHSLSTYYITQVINGKVKYHIVNR